MVFSPPPPFLQYTVTKFSSSEINKYYRDHSSPCCGKDCADSTILLNNTVHQRWQYQQTSRNPLSSVFRGKTTCIMQCVPYNGKKQASVYLQLSAFFFLKQQMFSNCYITVGNGALDYLSTHAQVFIANV